MNEFMLYFFERSKKLLGIAALMVSLGVSVVSYAQPAPLEKHSRNNIYLFDCTRSMEKNGIWVPAKSSLQKTIELQAVQHNVKFSIVAFTDKGVIPDKKVLTFDGNGFKKAKWVEIDALLEQTIAEPQGHTNIVSALQKGYNLCEPSRENRIYLFTDGKHNIKGQGVDAVKNSINNWCKKHTKGDRLFYVMMTPEAIDPGVMACLDHCDDAFHVECKGGLVPQICDIGSHITASTDDLDEVSFIDFSEYESLSLSIECDDPVFEAQIVKVGDYRIFIQFKTRWYMSREELYQTLSERQSGENYEFKLRVTPKDKSYFIVNPDVQVTMKNRPLRKLEIFNGATNILTFPEVEWYDSFLWSDALPERPVEVDFSPIFEFCDNSSVATFVFQEIGKNPIDYVLTYNGRLLQPGERITVSRHDAESKLTLEFNHNAKEGQRCFALIPIQVNNIDKINGLTVEEFSPKINMSYNVCWNPLKTICFWLAVIIIALLVMWFIMIKPTKYRKIDISLLQIEGQGTGVYKRIKGYRQVALSSRRQSQSIISRIFTGKVLYITDAAFTSDIKIEKSARRSVRFYVPRTWSITPAVVNVSAELRDMNTGKVYEVKVS